MSPVLTGRFLSTVAPEKSYVILFLFHFCGSTYMCARSFHYIFCVLSHSVMSDFVAPQTVACQAPLVMGIYVFYLFSCIFQDSISPFFILLTLF